VIKAHAVRDWEYMCEHAAKAEDDIAKDLFVMDSANRLSHRLMIDADVIEGSWQAHRKAQPLEVGITYLPGGQRRHLNANAEEDRRKKSWQAQLERFRMSMIGGIALIAPMLLMALHNDRTTALATTSVSVLIFASMIAVLTPASPEVALGAVSAYAAVLVVFVGTTLPPAT